MKDPREIGRGAAALMGAEAVAITKAGRYTAPSGKVVDIAAAVAAAIAGTTNVRPSDELEVAPGWRRTEFEVRNETTLAAAKRLFDKKLDPVALNFASAHNPGGGFLGGARAQEESLCRSSALHACLHGQPFYAHHDKPRDPMYSAWLMHSPHVPVFRDDDGALLEDAWTCGFITSAAPNVKVLRDRSPQRLDEVPGVMRERIGRVLAVASRLGHRSVVLGAWGCGAFGGDTELVSSTFKSALSGPYRGLFEEVVFAVLDTTSSKRFISPFEERFSD